MRNENYLRIKKKLKKVKKRGRVRDLKREENRGTNLAPERRVEAMTNLGDLRLAI